MSDWSVDVCSSNLDQQGRAEAVSMLRLEIRSDLILYYPVTAGQSAAHPQHDLLCDGRIEDSGRLLPIIIAIAHLNGAFPFRSEEHTSELQSLMRISYAVF